MKIFLNLKDSVKEYSYPELIIWPNALIVLLYAIVDELLGVAECGLKFISLNTSPK